MIRDTRCVRKALQTSRAKSPGHKSGSELATRTRRCGRALLLATTLALSALSVSSIWLWPSPIAPLGLPPVASATGGGGIDFYDVCVEGDTFVWCLDRSCSMGWAGRVDIVKAEVTAALSQLSPPQEFSVVTFSDSVSVFAADPVEATPANIDAGIAFVNGYQVEGGSCLSDGVVAAVEIAELGAGESAVILVGDGVQLCGPGFAASPAEVVDMIAPSNPTMPIHSFYVSAAADGAPTFFAIADAFGGFFISPTLTIHEFLRGDVTQDGTFDVADPVALLAAGFLPGTDPPACSDAGDADDNGEVEYLVDAIVLLQRLFVPGSAPLPAPGSSCGSDPTPDGLFCSGGCP